MSFKKKPIDANEAVARVVYKLNDVFIIYPITPSSPMGELVDQLSSNGEKNIFGLQPSVSEMEHETGVAGALHGALQTGSLASTFTCSQGLLLMIPNMYKIAGEMTPCVIHVAARALATQALSIYGDHQDVMAVRQTGFAILSSGSVQEAQDTALVAQISTMDSKVPFVHFFDGFRTSHEINKIELIDDDIIKSMINEDAILEFKKRALRPDEPVIRGTAQNSDVYFQGREAVNKYYNEVPNIVQAKFDEFAKLTGRHYKIFDYYGSSNPDRVIIIMGSGVQTIKETIDVLNKKGENLGVIQVRLFRPFSAKYFVESLPKSVKKIAVLDRTKEPGSQGEPLYLDVVSALKQEKRFDIEVYGGRYGLASKDFTPAMVKGIFDSLKNNTIKNSFSVGINDDVTNLSINYSNDFNIALDDVKESIFFGLGSDGTVGANKNTIKIITDREKYYGQAYFVYDSKKSGSVTESHLRFGPKPINSPYLIQQADFIGCHQFPFIFKLDILSRIKKNGIFLLNTHYSKDEIWDKLPRIVQQTIIDKNVKFYVIDAYKVADEANMGTRINTIMQTCYFKLANVIPFDEAITDIKNAIIKTYSKKGQEIVDNNIKAVDGSISNLFQVEYPKVVSSNIKMEEKVGSDAPEFVKNFTAKLIAGKGEEIKVSEMPFDGTFPCDTTKYEKRDVADKISVWDESKCIQCGKCVFSCPHSCLESKTFTEKDLADAPSCFKVVSYKVDKSGEKKFRIQISPEDCTGCSICVLACPVGALSMQPKMNVINDEKTNFKYFNTIKKPVIENPKTIIDYQFKESFFKYSGACAGCGETPYLTLLSKIIGERGLVANATGCSSIYGGNLPTTPWGKTENGRGIAWSNSLFEDNAEFGFGFQISKETQIQETFDLMEKLKDVIGESLINDIKNNYGNNSATGIQEQINRVKKVKDLLSKNNSFDAKYLTSIIDVMIERSIWIVGGDGWAYDIGFSGLDHVLASGKNVKILVMDTEVYSNTGGQASKATNLGASARFAVNGKTTFKKDLGAMMMNYGNVYVAQVAIRADPNQTLKAFKEAEEYNGPAIIIGYSSCISHGAPLEKSFIQQKNCIDSGMWMLYRYNPALIEQGKNPLQIDSKEPNLDLLETYLYGETRYSVIKKSNPQKAAEIVEMLKKHISTRWKKYKILSDNNLI